MLSVIVYLSIVFIMLPGNQYGNSYNHRSGISMLSIDSQTVGMTSSSYDLNVSQAVVGTAASVSVTPGTVVSITINIMGDSSGYAEVSLNSGYYDNGATASLVAGTSYSIAVSNVRSGWAFWQWLTNAGNLVNSQSSSTSFTPTSSGGLTLVLYSTSWGNWGGYIETSSIAIYGAQGTFNVPSKITYVSGINNAPSSSEVDAFWVGIGGANNFDGLSGSNYLWQAGVIIWKNSSSDAPRILAFAEAAPNPPVFHDLSIQPGNVIQVSINYNSGNIICSASVTDSNNSRSWYYTDSGFVADTNSAEWVGEFPSSGSGNYASFSFSPVTFTVTPPMIAPLGRTRAGQTFEYNVFYSIHQYMLPSYISSNEVFTVNYKQQT